MKISDLADRSGTSVATIKYYVREGLLMQGERVGGNRTDYSEAHLHRLRLIRAMLEIGNLSVDTVSRVLVALEATEAPLVHTFEIAQAALAGSTTSPPPAPSADALARIDALRKRTPDWLAVVDNVGQNIAAAAIDAFDRAGHSLPDSYLDGYARGAQHTATADLDLVQAQGSREDMAEIMVVGSVLGDPLAQGLRRIAQAAVSAERNLE